MRDYAKVSPNFWTGKTGKDLRAKGPEAVIVALFLLTCPHANMLGMYWLPKLYIAHGTGLPLEGASKGLAWAIEGGFCHYDDATEMVWVVEMARFQVEPSLSPHDKRVIGVQREYDQLPENPFKSMFLERYAEAFHMAKPAGKGKGLRSPFKAPSKPGTGTGAGTRERNTPKPPKGGLVESAEMVGDGLTAQTADEFLAHRKRKRAPLTPRAWAGIKTEAQKAGWPLESAIVKAMARGWQSFDAAFVANEPPPGAAKEVAL